jgi:putative methanogenesis marker protein 12
MFIGIDHGTTAIRFASLENAFEFDRREVARCTASEIFSSIEEELDLKLDEIKLIALTYSMGDGFSTIKSIKDVENRGIKRKFGGHVGGGTRVFDVLRDSNLPCIIIPGIHSGMDIDPRMKVFSHGASPEKIGVAYHVYKKGYGNFIVSDISSNVVTLGVARKKIIGAIDACIFAPGIYQGPLDLEAIMKIDGGEITASDAFSSAGVLKMTSFTSLEEVMKAKKEESKLALSTMALFAAMEIAAMSILVKDYVSDVNRSEVFLAGGLSEILKDEIDDHLGTETIALGKWVAAKGCAEIARDVFNGTQDILGVDVNYKLRKAVKLLRFK